MRQATSTTRAAIARKTAEYERRGDRKPRAVFHVEHESAAQQHDRVSIGDFAHFNCK